ncbi:hypothetical protein CR513_32842, partial [Mucuna pruriens]
MLCLTLPILTTLEVVGLNAEVVLVLVVVVRIMFLLYPWILWPCNGTPYLETLITTNHMVSPSLTINIQLTSLLQHPLTLWLLLTPTPLPIIGTLTQVPLIMSPMSHNIQHQVPFKGLDQIVIGYGQGLNIQYVGVTKILSPTNSNIPLVLNDLLFVPLITKNLLSISQFAKDNSIYFEFHASFYLVKSQDTHEVLLKVSVVHNPIIHTTIARPSWVDAQHIVFKHCNFPSLNKNGNDFCSSYYLGKAHRLPSIVSTTVYNKSLELIYGDIWELAPLTSTNGFTY